MFLKEIRHFYEWKDLLYSPEHFVQGFPAFELAREWQEANGIPAGVSRQLDRISELEDLKLLFGIPQFKIPMPVLTQRSQTDLLAFCKNRKGLWILTVEGKETLGPRIRDWLAESPARSQKLSRLLEFLGISEKEALHLRFQLIRRLYSLITFMDDFSTPQGIFLVQGFGGDKSLYYDFTQFLSALGMRPSKDPLPVSLQLGGKHVYFVFYDS